MYITQRQNIPSVTHKQTHTFTCGRIALIAIDVFLEFFGKKVTTVCVTASEIASD